MIRKTFSKGERLKSNTLINRLFKEGQSFGMYPLRIVWIELPGEKVPPVQFALSVPKRKFPKAVQRNRIRRQVREAYRLNKHLLYQHFQGQNRHFAWMMLYVAKEPQSFQQIEAATKKVIKKFIKKTQPQTSSSTNPS